MLSSCQCFVVVRTLCNLTPHHRAMSLTNRQLVHFQSFVSQIHVPLIVFCASSTYMPILIPFILHMHDGLFTFVYSVPTVSLYIISIKQNKKGIVLFHYT